MKRFTIILIFVQILISCQESTKIQTADYIGQIDKINDMMTKFDRNKQVFILSSKNKQTIIAKNGLKFLFDASQLDSEDGSPLSDSISIEVIECINQSDFIKANIQTISNGKLLVSSGAYKISMFSNGKKIKIQDKDSLTVYLPRLTEDEMNLFYGLRDSIGQIQWINVNKKLEKAAAFPAKAELSLLERIRSDTTKNMVDYYSPIKIASLDWINCDRFYEIKEKTNISLSLETNQDSLIVIAYLIFKDINSVTASVYIKSPKGILNNGFFDLPINSDVRMVAVSLKENQIFGFSKDFKIQKDESVKINLSQMTEQELNDLINKK